MPELPEVETIRTQLEPLLVDSSLVDAWAFPSAKFTQAIHAVGATIVALRRRGKYLLVDLDLDGEPWELVVHLGMTGRLFVDRPPSSVADDGTAHASSRPNADGWAATTLGAPEAATHLRARWRLEDGRTLCFDDVRRFGRIAVVPRGDHSGLPTLAALGPEPFDDRFTPEMLRGEVNRSSRAVKTQLLGQRIVAGVGNIYADEALWRAGVHPASRRLTRAASASLRDSIREALQLGLANGGTTLRDYRDATGGAGRNQHHLECYGRAGEPCPRCGEPLRHGTLDARSTTWCAGCQRRTR